MMFGGLDERHHYWAEVAVDAPLQKLTYLCPVGQYELGQSVLVQLGRRKVTGVITNILTEDPKLDFTLKSILSPHDERPTLSQERIQWLEWISQYYLHPLGQVINHSFPPLKKKGARATKRGDVVSERKEKIPPQLTNEQKIVIDSIRSQSGFGAHLVFGVTGSGKTEIYLRLLEDVLSRGEQAIVLVPEISLTPQLVRRFVERFGQKVAVYHSQLTEREKTNQWWEMTTGNKSILIGARSALFCPMPRLGLIVIDEEHEPSFKQDETLKYNARDAGVMLAKIFDIPIVLGSATPSLESYQNALEKKYSMHFLRERVEGRALPTIEVVSMKQKIPDETKPSDLPFWLSSTLFEKLSDRIARKEQSALFLNRRGTAQTVLCPACGATEQCPNCSVGLTLHGRVHLVCHYCDYDQTLPEICPTCKSSELKALGVGTELIEMDLAKLFPTAKLERLDRDRVGNRQELEDLIDRMESGDIDILIGTQMIAKGLDFERLTLVGMVMADIGFNLPDFRASERSFQLLMQMAGRAGRHHKPGEVVIQAYNTDHPSLVFATQHDYEGFAREELSKRRELFYPPYHRLACIKFQGLNLNSVLSAAESLGDVARGMVIERPELKGVEVLGPCESPLAKLRNQFRYQMIIKASKFQAINRVCQVLAEFEFKGVKVSFDIDPMSML